MNKADLKIEYESRVSLYREALGRGTKLIQGQLQEFEIDISTIQSRIKTFESFFEKIRRKKYENPFIDIEDIAGLRIICYYPSDVASIEKLISSVFNLESAIDKSDHLDIDKFGYRSNHYVIKLKCDNDSEFNEQSTDCKIEIQVRTLLMHVWASIQEKLEYKKEKHSPRRFRRKLMQLSALLELADQQFQDLKDEKEFLRSNLENSKGKFESGAEMNIDSFFAFIDLYFPNRKFDYRYTKTLFIEIQKLGIDFSEIIAGINQMKNILNKVEFDIEGQKNKWSKNVALKTILELSNETYWSNRSLEYLQSKRGKAIDKWRKIFKD